MTNWAYFRFSSSGIWRLRRARTSASVDPSRRIARSTCCSSAAGHQDDPVETPITARLDQDGRFHYGDSEAGRAPRIRRSTFPRGANTAGCTSAFRRASRSGAPKTRCGEQRPVDLPVAVQNFAPEFPNHSVVRLSAGSQHLMSQLVGLDQEASPARPAFLPRSFCRKPSRRSALLLTYARSRSRCHGIDHQHGDGQRAHSSRHRTCTPKLSPPRRAGPHRPPARCPWHRKPPAFRASCGKCAPRPRACRGDSCPRRSPSTPGFR